MMLSDSQFDAAAQAVVQPDTDPIDRAAQQVAGDQKTQLRASLYSSLMANPDMAARAQRLGRKTGIPGDVVERNLPEVERSAALTDIDRALEGSPLLAQWMADPKNARVSHDDVPQMGAIEAAVKWLVSAPDAPSTLGGSLRSAYHGASAGSAGAFQAVSGTVAPLLDFLEPVQGIGGNPLRRLQEGFGLIAQDALASQKAARGKSATWLGAAVDSGVESLAQNAGFLPLALLPGGQAAALTGMSAMAGGQTYTQDIQKGQGHWTAAMHGASDALIEGWTERFALGRLIGEVKAGAPLFQTLLKNAALEVPGEQAATALQDLNDWAVNNNGRTFGDYLKERPEAAAQTLIATLVGVGGNVAIMKGVQGVADRAAGTERRAQLAEQHGQALADVSKLIEASKLRQRDPEAFATFAQSLTEEGVSSLYVDARALQQSGVDLQALAQAMPSVAQQIEQAAATGGDVVIPTAEFLTQAPGQEWSAALIDHARTGADAMSPAGAREYMQAHGEQLQEEIARTIEQHATDTEWQAGRDAVRADFQRQLDEVGRWQPEVNRRYAALLGDYYAATAARAGTTPQELAARYPLRIQATAPGGSVNAMEQVDTLPKLRASTVEASKAFYAMDARAASGEQVDPDEYMRLADEQSSAQDALSAGIAAIPDEAFGLQAATRDGRMLVLNASAQQPGKWQLTRFDKDGVPFMDTQHDTKLSAVKEFVHESDPSSIKSFDQTLNQSAQLPATIDIDGQQRPTTNSKGQPIAATEEGVRNFWRWFGDSKVVDGDGRPLVVYHGTKGNFDSFNPGKLGSASKATSAKGGFFFAAEPDRAAFFSELGKDRDYVEAEQQNNADSKKFFKLKKDLLKVASKYSDGVNWPGDRYVAVLGAKDGTYHPAVVAVARELKVLDDKITEFRNWPKPHAVMQPGYTTFGGRNTIPVYLSAVNPKVVDFGGADRTHADLTRAINKTKKDGYDSLIAKNIKDPSVGDNYIVFNPEQIKSAIGNRGTFDPNDANILNQFAGPNAATADAHALASAQQRIAAGGDAEQVRKDTGWHQGADGKWRFEISDDVAVTKGTGTFGEVVMRWYRVGAERTGDQLYKTTVADVLMHPALFAAYPQIAGTEVQMMPDGVKASGRVVRVEGEAPVIQIREDLSSAEWKTTLLHEIQHGIQEIEGFAKGGAVEQFARGRMFNAKARDLAAELSEALTGSVTATPAEIADSVRYGDAEELSRIASRHGFRSLDAALEFLASEDAKRTPFGQYRRLAGEVEARNTQARATMTDAERAATPPEQTADVKRDDVIVTFNGREMRNAPEPANAVAQPARGQIAFGQDITQAPSVISLFNGADFSTLIHEAGHFFLEAHMDLAARIAGRVADGEQVSDGERGIVADANALLGWFGVKGDESAGGAAGGALEQPAYHGTPHRGIDRFSTDKIGTGEGAQAYGWGLYFASKKEIAEHYRKVLAEQRFDGPDGDESARGVATWLVVNGMPEGLADVVYSSLVDMSLNGVDYKSIPEMATAWGRVGKGRIAEYLRKAADAGFSAHPAGQLYDVDIPEDSEMLLWDKPLSDQPDVVRKSANSLRGDLSQSWLDDELERINADWDELTGQDLYKLMQKALVDDALIPNAGSQAEDALINGAADKAASLLLMDDGIKGIKYLDGTSRNAGDGSYNYVIFSGDDVAIKNTFYQGGQPDARPEPPPIGRTPLETWSMMSIDQKRAFHEQFARGFELYALEGKAPSLSLQSVFQRFSAWLKNVYRSITQRSAEDVLQVTLTDEVRQVMDRMIATDEQIAEAQAMREMGPLFGGADQAGMTPEQWAQYHELAAQATAQASEQLQARGLRDMQWLRNARSRELKRLQDRAAGLRREVEIEVRREVLSTPIYRAWQFLTTKGDAQATAQPTPRVRASGALDPASDNLFTAIAKLGGLDRSEVVGAWGVDPKDRLESGVFGAPVLRKEGGLSIDAMAEKLAEEGYLLRDESGRTDPADLEAAFDSQRRGVDQFSTWHDLTEDARVRAATGADAPEALPDEIMHGKLDTAVLRDMYGTKPDALWRTLSTRRMTSEASGIHPEVVAETFGYDSADALVRALAAADPPRQVIEGMTDQRMLERYGDLATPEGLQREADKAIHNEARARAIATELDALEKMGKVRSGEPRTADVLAKAARDYAAAVIGSKKVRDIRPGEYTAAEARASKAAQKAFKAGDTQAAATEKRHQLIQHAAAKAALQAREEIDKAVGYLRRASKRPKGLDAGYADQIDRLLERFDLKAVSNKELDKRSGLAAWVESQREQGMEPDIAPELLNESARTNWRNLTLDELRGLRDAVKQIEHLGRLKGKLLASKAKRDFEAVRDELADSIEANSRGRTADTRTPATVLGRRLAAIKRFGSAHIKAATWARIFDGGRDGGPVWEYLIRGANVAGDFETTRRAQATEALTKILAPVMKSSKLHRKAQYASVNRSLTREQVLVMALNTGNEGNWQRMLDGEGWTRPQVMAVLNTLTASEWQAVQGVWDHMESYRPEIGAKEKRVYGKEPEWVQAVPLLVDTADGQRLTLRGGYFPIKYDPAANAQAEQHADAEDAKQMMRGAYTSATTRRGFTKSRVQEVKGRPLMYSLGAVYGGVQDVIHDLAWHEWLIDTNKLLRSTKVDGAIRQHYGPEVVRQFKEWVRDVAAGDRPQQAAADEVLSRIRRGVSMAGLGFNVMSAAMQPLGLTQSIVRVGAPWVARGVAQYIANPLAATRRVVAASDFMAGRSRTRFRELNELRNQVEGESGAMRWVNRNAFWLMLRAQQAVDVPTWLGAYEKAISEGVDEARAVALADQAVLDAQGGGQVKDQAGIERGGPAQKLFTVFYSFMNTALNAGVAQTMTADTRAKKAKLAVDLLLLYTVPAVLGAMLKDALTPGDSGDDEPEELAKKVAAAQLDYLMGLFMLVRETTESVKIVTGLTDRPRDYAGPAGLRLIPDAVAFAKQARQAWGDGEIDDAFRKAAINLTGDLFGLPAAQVNRTITGAMALADDETDNPAALVFGFQKDR